MGDQHNVEFEAAKFLQKLIHESKDEPAKLATKLYVILQHMKASGKENSMPYQVISRAMETVINQHGLDIEALMSSRLPLSSGSHGGESARVQSAGCSQSVGGATDSRSGLIENDTTRPDGFGTGRPPAVPSSVGNDPFQGSVSQRSAMSFDHESPSSMETRSTNSHSQDRRDPPGWEQQGIQKDPKRTNFKRKRTDSSGMETQDDISQQLESHSGIPDVRKERFTHKPEAGGTLPVDSESWKMGLFKGATSFHERGVPGPPSSGIQVDSSRNLTSGSSLDAAGTSHIPANTDRLSQGGNPNTLCEVGIAGNLASRDTGKHHATPASRSCMPFKEHHLKQLRAQCLVFLAFRNGLSPKKLHLEIALGNMVPKEGTSSCVEGAQNELIQDKGKQQSTLASSSISEIPLSHGNMATVKSDVAPTVSSAADYIRGADLVLEGPENVKPVVGYISSLADPSHADEEKNCHLVGHGDKVADTENPETANCSALMTASLQSDTSGMRSPATHIHEEKMLHGAANYAAALMGLNKQLRPEMNRWSRVNQNDISRGTLPASFQHDIGSSNENSSILSLHDSNIQNQQRVDSQISTSWKSIQSMDSGQHRARPVNDANSLLRNALFDGNGALENQTRSILDGSKVVTVSDSSYMFKDSSLLTSMDKLPEPEEGEKTIAANLLPSPKHTLSEKWIIAHQKKKIATEQKWVQKLQNADERIATRFSELKETVSSSADISAKTRSVIELKKLQLLELQRCLRRNILSDFFKPIQTEMDRLKSIKKHRIGRRLKHVEKYEQKMKEERQKRIRERQKEFFSEVEVHKERLEDVFKYKRERCKTFNRYVKEYHKRKERIHREKIDRIQREKINLLKINDVEGYLRMVQDAKSDRVNKLLKETEKYLQKLGSRLKEAKAAARQVEMDDGAIIDDSSDIFTETGDENDQAKHYKESNEKYYLIAHSIKENIAEQPTELRGGKLREYQMNGLRWLVSLYNNHLNGILADEMGLGKTVQVISLICYLMETKNDRGPFLVVVPSSVLPGWENEMNFWAPSINKIVYAGPPEERRRLFKESIVHQKFNVLLTTYEYLMNKHDRPKLSKIHWHYIIIDEGHRIKNASCKLNADLKYYNSSHRLLLTGTPLQNNLEELWALLNFLLPNIFNSSEDFSQWFNKPFESNGDNSPDETLLSEEENLLIINRLHQVLRPFVLRRLKHKVENELPEKIERLVRCEASAYQKLLMKRVEENLGSLGVSKARAVHNSVMELRNICNHPYLSQLHAEEVDSYIPKHFLPPIVRLCGKLEMLDRLLPKLKETNHRVLFFSTMTRLLDVMEEYLGWKKYRYLRLDGHTSGLDRGALIDKFNQPDSPFFIFLLSIRAGGVGVNLQAADTVIIFDTDWNPQVDLQAQARAHRIGQKKDVLVLRLETVNTVEEQVRAAAEHKLGVANQSITAGFFDNNTSAEDRREYLESLLRESKKEEAAPVLDDDSLNDILARSESEIDVFEAVDQKRREEEMAIWKRVVSEKRDDCSDAVPPLPSRLVTDDDLTAFYEAMKVYDIPNDEAGSSSGMKRKSGCLGGFDTQQYGRGKRAREVRSYEEQWTEEEFEKMCQAESPEAAKPKDEKISLAPETNLIAVKLEPSLQTPQASPPSLEVSPLVKQEATPPVKRGRGRPRRLPVDVSPAMSVSSTAIGVSKPGTQMQKGINSSGLDPIGTPVVTKGASGDNLQVVAMASQSSHAAPPSLPSVDPGVQSDHGNTPVTTQPKRQGRRGQPTEKNIDGNSGTESVRRRGRKPGRALSPVPSSSCAQDSKVIEKPRDQFSSDIAVSTIPPVSSCNPLADSVGASHPNGSEGRAGTAVEDPKESTLVTKGTSSNIPVKESAAVQDPKPYDQLTKPAVLDSSSVALIPPEVSSLSKGDPVSQEQVVSISASSMVGTLCSGTELHKVTPQAANPTSELALPSPVGLRPGRRQSQKPQSGIEPIRRRGRKRGRIASTDLASPYLQDKNVNEPATNIGSLPTSAVTNVATPSTPVTMGMDPLLATVPVIPLVPVSGLMLGATPTGNPIHHVSTALASSMPASSQQSLLSGTLDMPPNIPKSPVQLLPQEQDQRVQAGETAPRRRGSKKSAASPGNNLAGQNLSTRQSNRSTGDFVERKVIATRSRQINISQAQNSQASANTRDTSVALNSKNLVAVQSSKLPSQVVNPSNLGSLSVEAVEASKPPELRRANPREGTAVCRIPAEIPPVSCKGKTNVIVLALELTTLDKDPTSTSCSNADGKEKCLNLRKDSARDVLPPVVQVSGLEATSAAKIQAPTQDDELSAPPGFDIPRPTLYDAAVRKSFENDDCGSHKISDAKRGSVVLALESTTRTVEPRSILCEKRSEEQESSESHRVKDLVMGSIPLSEPIGSEPVCKSVDNLTSQSEEEMSAPPGFDIPQRCISENAVAMSLEGVHGLASDMQADIAFKAKAENNSLGPDDDNPVNYTVPSALNSVGSDIVPASTLELSPRKQENSHGLDDGNADADNGPHVSHVGDSVTVNSSTLESKIVELPHGPNDAYTEKDICVPDSNAAVASTLDSKVENLLHGSGDGTGEHETGDAPITSFDLGSNTPTISTCVSREKEECHRPDDNDVEVEHDIGTASSSDAEGSHIETSSTLEPKDELGCHGPDAGDAPTASHVEDLDAKEVSLLESKREDEPDDGKVAHDSGAYAVAVTSISDSKEMEESLEPDDGKVVHDPGAYAVVVTSISDPKEMEESLEPDDGKVAHDSGAYAVAVTSMSDSKEMEESLEPDDGKVAHDPGAYAVAVTSISDSKEMEENLEPGIANAESEDGNVGYDTMASSSLETKQKEECHESDNFNAENATGNVVFDAVASSNLELEEKKEFDELDNSNAGSGAINEFSETVPSSLELKKEQCHEPDNANTENDTDSMFTDTLASASLDLKEREKYHESDNTNARDDSENEVFDMVASQSLESEAKEELHESNNANARNDADTMASSTLDLKEKEGCQEPDDANAGDNADNMVSNNVGSSSFEVKEKVECHELDNANAGNDTGNVVSDVVTSSSLKLKEKEECLEPENANVGNYAAKVVSDTVASSPELQEKEECQELDNANAGNDTGNVVSDVVTSSSLKLEEKEECLVPVDGKDEKDASNTLPASLALNSDTVATSPRESKEKEEFHGHSDGNVGLDVHDAPTSSCIIGSDTQTVLTEEFKENKECAGPEDGAVDLDAIEHKALSISPSCIVASDNQAASALDSEEKQECIHDIVATSPLESKATEECHGSSATTELDATINVVDSEMVPASSLELKEEGDEHDKENNKHGDDDVLEKSDIPVTSILPSKDEQDIPRINDGNVEQDGGDGNVERDGGDGNVERDGGGDGNVERDGGGDGNVERDGDGDGNVEQDGGGVPATSDVAIDNSTTASTLE